ncbi:transmembrane and coiled-coil domains protein 2 isoform X4 [Aethina tumida]|uniref:transmembrane and coiled-coil domains protein 2 isoform X4 n=1 Tax=Aethina tumida TaxID=116153 RepID=UPI002148106F|nr:transmembrane and coiled-coil domains protein 2 isoform X4 [Aethina tumida]
MFVLLDMWILPQKMLGEMDSLHVSSAVNQQQQSGSKTSSRSTSPCRPRDLHPIGGAVASSTPTTAAAAATTSTVPSHRPHHTKTLSHGSVESAKSQDGGGVSYAHRTSRHRSPTTSSSRTGPPDPDDSTTSVAASATAAVAMSASGLDDSLAIALAADTSASGCLTTADHLEHSSFLSNGSSEHGRQATDDEVDRVDIKTNTVLDQLKEKMNRVKNLMKTEQKLRDDNVNEYLKLASNADKQQVQRIKAVFEKKNQKSAQVISQLQKKLDSYQKRFNELETHGLSQSHRPPREVLRDMGQGLKNVGGNIRDGITGFSGSVMSKPREFAHLIKNKFGSADNISQLSTWYIGPGATGSEGSGGGGANGGSDQGEKVHHGSATLPATLHIVTSQSSMTRAHAAKFPSDEGSECSSDSIERYRPTDSGNQEAQFKTVYSQLHIKQLEIEHLKKKLESLGAKLESMRTCENDISILTAALQDEKYRRESLEEQVNDLTELHQNEVENLKQAMADMEEKVQYQSEERLRDIHEMLEHCQTKIQKMEHQALQQQQYVTLEGLDNSNARALVVKLINILLTVLQVVLLLVATGAGIIMPFLRTRVRILTTVAIVLASVFILRQWPEVQDIGSHVMKRLKDTLDPVQ